MDHAMTKIVSIGFGIVTNWLNGRLLGLDTLSISASAGSALEQAVGTREPGASS